MTNKKDGAETGGFDQLIVGERELSRVLGLRSEGMGYGLLLFLSALMGAICLIMQWIGPAGGA